MAMKNTPVNNFVVTAIATLGVGKIPKAPGTWGSLLAVLVWWALDFAGSPITNQLGAIFLATLLGWQATDLYEKWNNRHDPKEVVIDELVGMWLVLLITPRDPLFYALAFVLFRLFDIWKPFPISWVDRKVPGALGTMLDDVVAALFAVIVLLIVSLGGYFELFN